MTLNSQLYRLPLHTRHLPSQTSQSDPAQAFPASHEQQNARHPHAPSQTLPDLASYPKPVAGHSDP